MFTRREELVGTYGMVASTHWLASASGMSVLERGGNAFDAAAAAAFVLQVVEPHLNGPAGEVAAVFHAADADAPRVLCGQGVAPAGANVSHYTSLGLTEIPGSGLLAATVPGAWDAWLLLLRDYGTIPLREVLNYAISYAGRGFPLTRHASAAIASVSSVFDTNWTTSRDLWLPGGHIPRHRHANPVLAHTWERLLAAAESMTSDRTAQIEAARHEWAHGFVAEAIEIFCRTEALDDTGDRHAGLLTAEDLNDWQASYEDPLTIDVGEWTLAKCGPWSQGPVLAQMLLLLEGFVDELSYEGEMPTARTVHLTTECAKLAFADREAWYGDAEVPMADLLSANYLEQRRALVREDASLDLRPGSVAGRRPRLPACLRLQHESENATALSAAVLGEPGARLGRSRGDTVHVSVVDAKGNMVSATQSGGWLQSSPSIPSLGFCLGTRAQMFWLEEGLPNSLQPGKRPRITLSPTVAMRDGEPVLAFGSPGGDNQDQWQLCFWLAHTLGDMDIQRAADAPTWHSNAFPRSFSPRDWHPGHLAVEAQLGEAVISELCNRGHLVVDDDQASALAVVEREPATGLLKGAVSRRTGRGHVVGR
ncbi:gamma-glutamyltransferase family protein [Nocardia sp. NPDC051570]|uniref:gamma-glutamyltransferase family protein n=1 Tax=Nocardia sp. NPDC051570 TaxID=3364324 RepID=UPI0037907F3F